MTTLLALPAPALAQARPSKVVQALIAAAQKEFDAGHFERAGELFLEVWLQGKDSRPALYNAARGFHLAGKLDKAESLYRELLALPAPSPAASAPSPAASGPAQPANGQDTGPGASVRAATTQPQASTAPLAAWSTLGVGAAVLAGGGVVLALAKGDESDLAARFAARNGAGNIIGISHTEADADIERIEAKYRLGWGLAGIGAVATAVGVVWLLRSERAPAVVVAPAPSGLRVAFRF